MKVLVADDEPEAVDLISTLLEKSNIPTEIVTENRLEQVEDLLNHTEFDAAFLDIEFRNKTIFDVLQNLDEVPRLVFVSAHDHYALKAIKHSVFDYLLKPIDPLELDEISRKLYKDFNDQAPFDLKTSLHNMLNQSSFGNRVAIPTQNGYSYIDAGAIVRVEAKGAYALVVMSNEDSFLVSRNLKDFEKGLGSQSFMRVHRSHLINLAYVRQYSRIDGGVIEMSNGDQVAISRKYRDHTVQVLGVSVPRI